MTIRHVESMKSHIDYYSAQVDQALESGNLEEAFALSIGHSIFQNRDLARTDREKDYTLRDDRQKKVNEYAMTHQGFGINKGTGLTVMQAATSAMGGQHHSMAIGAFKGLTDEGNQANKILLDNNVQDLRRVQDEIQADSRRLESITDKALQMLSELHRKASDTKTAILR